tara:strand:- start:2012 stop:2476 length:465 start_codon:yes stop_codon:yes gene_type:complete
MRTLANILWHFPFFGFISALFSFILGGILTLTVIGAPIGLGLIQHSKFLMSPFSKAMISDSKLKKDKNPLWETFGVIIQILYFPLGLLLAFVTIIQIALLFITIIGIPVALVLSKSLSTYFNPVNKICVPVAVRDEIEKENAKRVVEKYLKKDK